METEDGRHYTTGEIVLVMLIVVAVIMGPVLLGGIYWYWFL